MNVVNHNIARVTKASRVCAPCRARGKGFKARIASVDMAPEAQSLWWTELFRQRSCPKTTVMPRIIALFERPYRRCRLRPSRLIRSFRGSGRGEEKLAGPKCDVHHISEF